MIRLECNLATYPLGDGLKDSNCTCITDPSPYNDHEAETEDEDVDQKVRAIPGLTSDENQ